MEKGATGGDSSQVGELTNKIAQMEIGLATKDTVSGSF